MKALSIAFKDLRILFRDRGSLVLLIILPLFFIIVMSGALTSLGQESADDARIPVTVPTHTGVPAKQAGEPVTEALRHVALEPGFHQIALDVVL